MITNKKKRNSKDLSYAKQLLHIPNPMHLEACKKGSSIQRNKKIYTRKNKHRKSFQ